MKKGKMSNTAILKTVANAIDVINLLSFSKRTWGPRDLARELGINKSSAQRILHTLREKKILAIDKDTGKYTFGPKMMGMAIAVYSQNSLAKLAKPIMRRFVNEINESLTLFSYREDEMVFQLSEEADHTLRFSLKLGVPQSIHAGVSGVVILANIPEAKAEAYYRSFEENNLCDVSALRQRVEQCKKNGYATAVGTRVRGVLGFAAPIYGSDREFLGGITLALPEARYHVEKHEILYTSVVNCAKEISDYLNTDIVNVPHCKKAPS